MIDVNYRCTLCDSTYTRLVSAKDCYVECTLSEAGEQAVHDLEYNLSNCIIEE